MAQPVMQFSADPYWQYYLKKLDSFFEKIAKNPKYIYDEEYDRISAYKNVELYDLYVSKYTQTIWEKRVNAPTEILKAGRDEFLKLDIRKQAEALLNIHQTFGRVAGGCDLRLIGGAGKAAATVNFSSTISNWKKNYSNVRLIDQSPSGIWEKQSDNLLDIV